MDIVRVVAGTLWRLAIATQTVVAEPAQTPLLDLPDNERP